MNIKTSAERQRVAILRCHLCKAEDEKKSILYDLHLLAEHIARDHCNFCLYQCNKCNKPFGTSFAAAFHIRPNGQCAKTPTRSEPSLSYVAVDELKLQDFWSIHTGLSESIVDMISNLKDLPETFRMLVGDVEKRSVETASLSCQTETYSTEEKDCQTEFESKETDRPRSKNTTKKTQTSFAWEPERTTGKSKKIQSRKKVETPMKTSTSKTPKMEETVKEEIIENDEFTTGGRSFVEKRLSSTRIKMMESKESTIQTAKPKKRIRKPTEPVWFDDLRRTILLQSNTVPQQNLIITPPKEKETPRRITKKMPKLEDEEKESEKPDNMNEMPKMEVNSNVSSATPTLDRLSTTISSPLEFNAVPQQVFAPPKENESEASEIKRRKPIVVAKPPVRRSIHSLDRLSTMRQDQKTTHPEEKGSEIAKKMMRLEANSALNCAAPPVLEESNVQQNPVMTQPKESEAEAPKRKRGRPRSRAPSPASRANSTAMLLTPKEPPKKLEAEAPKKKRGRPRSAANSTVKVDTKGIENSGGERMRDSIRERVEDARQSEVDRSVNVKTSTRSRRCNKTEKPSESKASLLDKTRRMSSAKERKCVKRKTKELTELHCSTGYLDESTIVEGLKEVKKEEPDFEVKTEPVEDTDLRTYSSLRVEPRRSVEVPTQQFSQNEDAESVMRDDLAWNESNMERNKPEVEKNEPVVSLSHDTGRQYHIPSCSPILKDPEVPPSIAECYQQFSRKSKNPRKTLLKTPTLPQDMQSHQQQSQTCEKPATVYWQDIYKYRYKAIVQAKQRKLSMLQKNRNLPMLPANPVSWFTYMLTAEKPLYSSYFYYNIPYADTNVKYRTDFIYAKKCIPLIEWLEYPEIYDNFVDYIQMKKLTEMEEQIQQQEAAGVPSILTDFGKSRIRSYENAQNMAKSVLCVNRMINAIETVEEVASDLLLVSVEDAYMSEQFMEEEDDDDMNVAELIKKAYKTPYGHALKDELNTCDQREKNDIWMHRIVDSQQMFEDYCETLKDCRLSGEVDHLHECRNEAREIKEREMVTGRMDPRQKKRKLAICLEEPMNYEKKRRSADAVREEETERYPMYAINKMTTSEPGRERVKVAILKCHLCKGQKEKADKLYDLHLLTEHLARHHCEFYLYQCNKCGMAFGTPFGAAFHVRPQGRCGTTPGEDSLSYVAVDEVDIQDFWKIHEGLSDSLVDMLNNLHDLPEPFRRHVRDVENTPAERTSSSCQTDSLPQQTEMKDEQCQTESLMRAEHEGPQSPDRAKKTQTDLPRKNSQTTQTHWPNKLTEEMLRTTMMRMEAYEEWCNERTLPSEKKDSTIRRRSKSCSPQRRRKSRSRSNSSLRVGAKRREIRERGVRGSKKLETKKKEIRRRRSKSSSSRHISTRRRNQRNTKSVFSRRSRRSSTERSRSISRSSRGRSSSSASRSSSSTSRSSSSTSTSSSSTSRSSREESCSSISRVMDLACAENSSSCPIQKQSELTPTTSSIAMPLAETSEDPEAAAMPSVPNVDAFKCSSVECDKGGAATSSQEVSTTEGTLPMPSQADGGISISLDSEQPMDEMDCSTKVVDDCIEREQYEVNENDMDTESQDEDGMDGIVMVNNGPLVPTLIKEETDREEDTEDEKTKGTLTTTYSYSFPSVEKIENTDCQSSPVKKLPNSALNSVLNRVRRSRWDREEKEVAEKAESVLLTPPQPPTPPDLPEENNILLNAVMFTKCDRQQFWYAYKNEKNLSKYWQLQYDEDYSKMMERRASGMNELRDKMDNLNSSCSGPNAAWLCEPLNNMREESQIKLGQNPEGPIRTVQQCENMMLQQQLSNPSDKAGESSGFFYNYDDYYAIMSRSRGFMSKSEF